MSTSDNYINKKVINTDDDHPEPNLINNSLSITQLRDKAYNDNIANEDSLMKKVDKLKTTETEMMFNLFANKEKMVPKAEVKQFDKSNYSAKYSEVKNNSENIDDYIGKKSENVYNNIPPKPSTYGPSFGDGPAIPNNNNNNNDDDKYSEEKKEFETKEDEMLAKLNMLRKLGELTQYGVKLSQNYNMNSDYNAMKYEYELHRGIRDKHNGIKWLSNMMVLGCQGIEIANEYWNPFDFKLKGWNEQMREDQNEYYDVYGELYEKYFKSGKPIPPELKLLFMITCSAITFHATHTFLNSMPNLGDVFSKNPQLREQLRKKAMDDSQKNNNMDEIINKQHGEATKKAVDMEMLRQKAVEHQTEQEILKKQSQLNQLYNQLNQQRSDSRSMYSSYSNNQPMQNQPINGQPTMTRPIIPNSLQTNNQFNERKQQYELYRQQNEYNNTNNMSDGSSVNYNPNLDYIINSKLGNNKINEISILDKSELNSSIGTNGTGETENSKIVFGGRRRRKKNSIKIDT